MTRARMLALAVLASLIVVSSALEIGRAHV